MSVVVYFFIRFITYPLRFLPYSTIHFLGRLLGSICFYLLTNYRKRTLSNLALASDLHLSQKELLRIAKASFQNLAINCLEYTKFYYEKDLSQVIQCENPEIAHKLYQEGKGIIFFCGHQSNWEVLFLDGTFRMKGVAIGKPIKNKFLYRWIVSIREKFGGKIISQRNALRDGLKALKQGTFLGIVGDQGMPNSGYSSPFLGRKAWTSPAPAMLAYRANSPIIVATTRRVKGKYLIHYSDPLWPDLSQPIDSEVVRLMDESLKIFQESIAKSPGEWLWQHNRWKQQTPRTIYKPFRKDCICLILPEEKKEFNKLSPHLRTIREIYSLDFLILLTPKVFSSIPFLAADEVITYQEKKEIFRKDYRFKLVFNFTPQKKIKKHYLNLGAFKVLDLAELKQLASPFLPKEKEENLSEILKRALCRPGTLWQEERICP